MAVESPAWAMDAKTLDSSHRRWFHVCLLFIVWWAIDSYQKSQSRKRCSRRRRWRFCNLSGEARFTVSAHFDQSLVLAIGHYSTSAFTLTYLSGRIWFVFIPSVFLVLLLILNRFTSFSHKFRYPVPIISLSILAFFVGCANSYKNNVTESLFDLKYFSIEFLDVCHIC